MSQKKSALIVGGGIGGLAAALAFAQRGWRVRVLEQAHALREVGAGIQLAPNGMKVLRALGLEQAVLSRGFLPEALEMRLGISGFQVFKIPIKNDAQYRWRAPYVHIHRADLIEVLSSALHEIAPDALLLGTRVEGLDDDAVLLRKGERLGGDVIVAADGLRSVLRARAFGEQSVRYTGMLAFRATVPKAVLGSEVPPPSTCVWAGPGRHAVTYYVRRGETANFVGVVEKDLEHPDQLDSWDTRGSVNQALEDFSGWQPVIERLIRASGGLGRWALFDRPPSERWVKGRLVLLGDAAHPMLPTFAQGGCQALEDAWALAALADGSSDIDAGLADYADLRQPRTRDIQQRALRNATDFHQDAGFEAFRAYSTLWFGGRFLPFAAKARLDGIYGYDVVEELQGI